MTKLFDDNIEELITKPVSEPEYASEKSGISVLMKLNELMNLCVRIDEFMVFPTVILSGSEERQGHYVPILLVHIHYVQNAEQM